MDISSWTIEEWSKLLGLIAGAVGGAIAFWRKCVKPVVAYFREQHNLLQQIPKLSHDVKNIRMSVEGIGEKQEIQAQNSECIMDSMGKGFFQANPDGTLFHVSPPLCRMADRSEQEMRGHNWMTWVHPQDRDETWKQWKDARKDGRSFDHTFRFLQSDGTIVTFHMRVFPVPRNVPAASVKHYFGTIEIVS